MSGSTCLPAWEQCLILGACFLQFLLPGGMCGFCPLENLPMIIIVLGSECRAGIPDFLDDVISHG